MGLVAAPPQLFSVDRDQRDESVAASGYEPLAPFLPLDWDELATLPAEEAQERLISFCTGIKSHGEGLLVKASMEPDFKRRGRIGEMGLQNFLNGTAICNAYAPTREIAESMFEQIDPARTFVAESYGMLADAVESDFFTARTTLLGLNPDHTFEEALHTLQEIRDQTDYKYEELQQRSIQLLDVFNLEENRIAVSLNLLGYWFQLLRREVFEHETIWVTERDKEERIPPVVGLIFQLSWYILTGQADSIRSAFYYLMQRYEEIQNNPDFSIADLPGQPVLNGHIVRFDAEEQKREQTVHVRSGGGTVIMEEVKVTHGLYTMTKHSEESFEFSGDEVGEVVFKDRKIISKKLVPYKIPAELELPGGVIHLTRTKEYETAVTITPGGGDVCVGPYGDSKEDPWLAAATKGSVRYTAQKPQVCHHYSGEEVGRVVFKNGEIVSSDLQSHTDESYGIFYTAMSPSAYREKWLGTLFHEVFWSSNSDATFRPALVTFNTLIQLEELGEEQHSERAELLLSLAENLLEKRLFGSAAFILEDQQLGAMGAQATALLAEIPEDVRLAAIYDFALTELLGIFIPFGITRSLLGRLSTYLIAGKWIAEPTKRAAILFSFLSRAAITAFPVTFSYREVNKMAGKSVAESFWEDYMFIGSAMLLMEGVYILHGNGFARMVTQNRWGFGRFKHSLGGTYPGMSFAGYTVDLPNLSIAGSMLSSSSLLMSQGLLFAVADIDDAMKSEKGLPDEVGGWFSIWIQGILRAIAFSTRPRMGLASRPQTPRAVPRGGIPRDIRRQWARALSPEGLRAIGQSVQAHALRRDFGELLMYLIAFSIVAKSIPEHLPGGPQLIETRSSGRRTGASRARQRQQDPTATLPDAEFLARYFQQLRWGKDMDALKSQLHDSIFVERPWQINDEQIQADQFVRFVWEGQNDSLVTEFTANGKFKGFLQLASGKSYLVFEIPENKWHARFWQDEIYVTRPPQNFTRQHFAIPEAGISLFE